ncbi:hypothetical protein SDC9_12964 [bioreactor metagenome]|uniref:Uncharacterized protein n=1 Tax=bioreactor metagenome TaxID=1076179 RepID=A0A644TK40_9ZZZZ
MRRLDRVQTGRGEAQRLVPADLAPGVGDALAHHRFQDPVAVRGIAPGEAALDAGMAAVRLAALPGHHSHQLLAAHLGLEGAADAAIGAGGDDRPFRRADLLDRFLDQRRGRAGLHAGAAADAVGGQEIGRGGRDPGIEAAPLDGQREGALHLLAGPHAAHADDALRRVIAEIGVRDVLRDVARVRLAIRAHLEMVLAPGIAHLAQADGTGHVLQLAIAVRGAGQAVERVVGDVKLHHPAAQLCQLRGLGVNLHPLAHRRGAGGRRAAHAVDLDHAQPARADRLEAVGGTKLRDGDPGLGRGAHHRGARGHGDGHTVDQQMHRLARARGRAHVLGPAGFGDDEVLHSAASRTGVNSSGKCRNALCTG